MKTINITYDIDDTLWDLNGRICKKHNININKIKRFKIKENESLTEREKAILLSEYSNSNIFENIEWYNGIERITNVEKLSTNNVKIQVWVHSNSFSQEIADLKLKQIKDKVSIPKNRIILDTINVSKAGRKNINIDNFILIDDSPYTVKDSQAEINMSLATPWITSKYATEIIGNKDLIIKNNLIEVINEIHELVYNKIKIY